MTWYQDKSQQQKWRAFISKPQFDVNEMMNSEPFMTQVKNGNMEISSWMQANYRKLFQDILTKVLIIPNEGESHERKFKEPTQSMNFISMILQVAGPNSGAGALNINSSLSSSLTGSMMVNDNCCKTGISSPQVIKYICEKMFELYLKNPVQKLNNTLIPGFFFRLFDNLYRFHFSPLVSALKTLPSTFYDQIIDKHLHLQNIARFVNSILVVPYTNVAMTSMVSITQSYGQMVTIPYQIKFRILNHFFNRLRRLQLLAPNQSGNQNYWLAAQNIFAIFVEILRNNLTICDGTLLTQSICKQQNMHIYFNMAFKLKQFQAGQQECQEKCFLLLCTIVQNMTSIERSKYDQRFQQILKRIMGINKLKRKDIFYLELGLQWMMGEVKSCKNMQSDRSINQSMSRNSSVGFSNSSMSFSMTGKSTLDIPIYMQNVLSNELVFKKLLKLCEENKNCNILHKRTQQFFHAVFSTRNEKIITSVFVENNIIEQSLNKLKNFKQNADFGLYIKIIQIFTHQRLETPIINDVLEKNQEIWKNYVENVKDYFNIKQGKCGFYNFPEPDPNVNIFTVRKVDKKNETKNSDKAEKDKVSVNFQYTNPSSKKEQQGNKMKEKIDEIDDNIQQITFNPTPPLSFKKKVNKEALPQQQGISIKLEQPKNKQLNEQVETESFESFLKRQLSQKQKQIDGRKKTRTPTKLKSASSKKKKWGQAEQDQSQNSGICPNTMNFRKTVSVDDKQKQKIVEIIEQQNVEKPGMISFIKIKKENYPKKTKQSKMDKFLDNRLAMWLQRANRSSQRTTAKVR